MNNTTTQAVPILASRPAQAATRPTPGGEGATLRDTIRRRCYTPYAYQVAVAASQMQDRAGRVASSPLLNGLVAYWKLDETSGTRFDSAGTNNLSDNGSVGSALGKQGNAARFDTLDQALDGGNVLAFERTDVFSVFAWVYLTDTSSTREVIGKIHPTGQQGWEMRVDSGILTVLIASNWSTNGIGVRHTGTSISANTWYQIGFTYDGSSSASGVKLYINGAAVVADTILEDSLTSTIVSTASLFIGARFSSFASQFAGRIDEVGIWNRLLADGAGGDIEQLYNSGAALTYPFS
jgi:hypothetical protein